jgi:hypothetical protein
MTRADRCRDRARRMLESAERHDARAEQEARREWDGWGEAPEETAAYWRERAAALRTIAERYARRAEGAA